MRVRLLVSAALSARRHRLPVVATALAAATAAVVVPIAVDAAAASADPASDATPTVVKVALVAPGSVTRGAGTSLLAKVSLASVPVPGRSVQFVRRPIGSDTWQVLGSATTGQDGTTTLPVRSVDAGTEYAAYYAESSPVPLRSDPATAVVHVIDLQPAAPKSVTYGSKVSVAAHLVQDGTQPVPSEPVQVRFRTNPHQAWGRPKWTMTNAAGVASVAAKFARTFQVGVRFPGAAGLAPSPFKVATVRVGPKPAVAPSGFRFPFLDPAQATSPGTWTLDQGVDMFAIGQACGAAAKLVAVGDGTVVQTGISGFGPTAPVIAMTSGPFKGRNVYYGHTGRVFVHAGQAVKAGDLVAEIGCGRVGMSSAPHLEIGVGAPGGPPCCPGWHQTSGLMMRQLLAALRNG